MANYIAVDRIEGSLAVCVTDDRQSQALPLSSLPPGLREGDILRETPTGWELDEAEAARRREKNSALFTRLRKKPPE